MFQPLFGQLDNNIVVAVNNSGSPAFDTLILIVTNFWFFVGVVCCIFAYAFWKEKPRKALLFCVLLLITIGCSDLVSAGIIRPLVQQLRPTNPDNPVHVLLRIVHGITGGKYGFPSCHAANSFAIAVFTSLWFRKWWITITLIIWALLECYTRLYLGVHYPSDLLFGIAIGSLVAYIIYRLSQRIFRKLLQ